MDSLQQGSSFPPSTSLGDFKLVMNDVVAQGGADGLFELCFIGAISGGDLYVCYFSEPFVALYVVGLEYLRLETGDWRLVTDY